MTKNNLAVHLKWLLQQGPSLYPTLSTDIPTETANRVPHQRTPPPDDIQLLDQHVENLDDLEDENMARLMLAPSSGSKSKMLSRGDARLPSSPTVAKKPPSSSAVISESFLEPPSSSTQILRPKATPIRPDRRIATSPFDGIESIDLTGDPDRFLASDVKLDLAAQRRLWNKNAASQEVVSEKRGRKRKSDEYKTDLLSPAKLAAKAASPSKESSLSPTKAVISELPSRKSRLRSLDLPRKNQKREVADSDGEDPFDETWLHDDEMVIDANTGLYPRLPPVSPLNDPKVDVVAPTAQSTQQAIASNKKPSVTHPVKREHSGSSSSIPGPAVPSSQSKDESILKFMNLSENTCNAVIAKLQQTLQKNAEIVYEEAMAGRPAPELVAANKGLVSQIESVQWLQTLKTTYSDSLSRRQHLKQGLMRAISQGQDPTSLPELSQSLAVEAEIENTETSIRKLLSETGILEHAAGYGDAADDASVSVSSSFHQADNGASRQTTSNVQSLYTSATSSQKAQNDSATFDVRIQPRNHEAGITRNMASPEVDFDDFDWSDSDDEMLEAAGSFDHQTQPAAREPAHRNILTETSGNSSRAPMPPPKKSPARNNFWSNHPWSQEVKSVLKDRFHLRGFRPNQLEAIDATLGGKDVFVLMPTGGGKSLCYQLPSIVTGGRTHGVTLVVSPLLSLMQDQVDHLRKLHIKAFLINGESDRAERSRILSQLHSGDVEDLELLYITPEMINKNQSLVRSLENLHRRQKLARLVIDEAHCVSQWGHDFRPDYKELGEIRAKLPGVPVMALTATATENVKVDVIHNLKMTGCEVFLQSFNRPNLTYEVRTKGKNDEVLASIAETIKKSYKNQCGIVYCLSRKMCEKVAEDLCRKYRLRAAHYHAGMKSDDKAKVQNEWQQGTHHIIVATIAFGMGIDKPDVRFVMHHSIPKSLEGYYQETGRAGRDGKRSGCYLYYGYRDAATLKRMIDEGDGSYEQKTRQKHMLRNVVQFCENRSDCRRVQVLAYFNEYFRREDCASSCDNCKSEHAFELHDFSEYATWIIKIVRWFQNQPGPRGEMGEKVTVLYCVDVLRGDLKKAKSPGHKSMPWYGKGSDLDRGEAERLFYRLLGEDALAEDNVINGSDFAVQYLKLGRRATEYETGQKKLELHVRGSPKAKPKVAARPKQSTKSGTPVYPQSTMVSSPVQSANNRRQARSQQQQRRRRVDLDATDDESDGFEPVRVAGKPLNENGREVGPPIMADRKMDMLDHLHRAVVEDFEVSAKRYLQEIVVEKGLRSQPFPDQTLRDMAITFPKNMSELAAITGIDPDKVKRYGRQILKLIDNARRRYHELKDDAEANGVVPDPNHHNVINLSSSDEYSDDDLFVDQDPSLDLGYPVEVIPENITSRYFPPAPSPGPEPEDEFDRGSTTSRSKSSKRPYTRRPRRKNGSSTGTWKAKGPRSRAKSGGDRAASSRGSSFKGKTPSARGPSSTIGMMPI